MRTTAIKNDFLFVATKTLHWREKNGRKFAGFSIYVYLCCRLHKTFFTYGKTITSIFFTDRLLCGSQSSVERAFGMAAGLTSSRLPSPIMSRLGVNSCCHNIKRRWLIRLNGINAPSPDFISSLIFCQQEPPSGGFHTCGTCMT